MRTEREIREQIDKSMDAISEMPFCEEREFIASQVDALLWVIGDRSGAPIWGEER